jgi:hypothetical protein
MHQQNINILTPTWTYLNHCLLAGFFQAAVKLCKLVQGKQKSPSVAKEV